MDKLWYNMYLFSVDRCGDWRIIASTNGHEGEDLSALLGLPLREREFIERELLEDISNPILTCGERANSPVPVFIERRAVFEGLMCIALELCDVSLRDVGIMYERGIGRLIRSDETKLLMESCSCGVNCGSDDLRTASLIRDMFAFCDTVAQGRLYSAEVLEDVLICISALTGIEISLDLHDARMDTGDRGTIFAGGFCAYSLLAHSLIAKGIGNDVINVTACRDDSCPTIDISYCVRKKDGASVCDELSRIAEVIGIPFYVGVEDGRLNCKMIPEIVDEALEGVKEELLSSLQTDISDDWNNLYERKIIIE